MRWIDGERRQQREHVAQEEILQPRLFLLAHIRAIDQDDSLLGKNLAQLAPARLLMAREHRDRFADAAELFGRRQPVGALGGDTLAYLAFQAGDPDHEKLVEIVGGNRQETHPFE